VIGSIFSFYKNSVSTKVKHDICDLNKKSQFFLKKLKSGHNVLLIFLIKKGKKHCDRRRFLLKKSTKIPQYQKYIILSFYKKLIFF